MVGEFGVIARVLARAGTARAAEVGPGDDAAVLRTPDGRVVATTDVLVEGRHFRRDWSSAEDVGHKAAAANLADVAAMGARGDRAAGRARLPAGHPDGVAGGRGRRAGRRVRAAGRRRRRRGHWSPPRPDSDAVVLSVTALGDLGGRAPVLRSGARPGDVVALAGRLGWSACGLAVLRRGFSSPIAAVAAHRRPTPPYAAGPAAAEAGATAMCDVSDGLLADPGHLAAGSGVVVDLDRAALVRACLEPAGPLQQVGAALGGDPLAWVLTGGEDHALVATFPARTALPVGWTAIGAVRRRADGPGSGSTASRPRTSPRRSVRRGPAMSTSADGRWPRAAAVRVGLRPCGLRRPAGAVPGRAGPAGVRARATAAGTRRSSTPPSSSRRAGLFLVAEVDGVPAGCGAWRAHAAGRGGDQARVRRAGVPASRAGAAAHGGAGGAARPRPATAPSS